MKVDIVVNAMIQQIDRNLHSQVMPVQSYRIGEILRGRVMLTDGESPQIRLDNGALLNALPEMGVLLSNGATVTLRVTGQMDGQLVMQLLDQQLTDGRAAQAPGGSAAEAMEATPQGRAVLQAMDRMRLPVREDTARQALETMARFPGLGADKAVFLAANRVAATEASVVALNNLVEGRAMTGNELMNLADILTVAAVETEQAQQAVKPGGRLQPGQAAEGPNPDALGVPGTTDRGAAAPAQGKPQASLAAQGGVEIARPQQGGAGEALFRVFSPPVFDGSDAPAAAQGQPKPAAATRDPGAPAAAQAVAPSQTAAASPAEPSDGMLELQSLAFVALGVGAAESGAGASMALQKLGLLRQAVALALDGPFLSDPDVAARLQAFVSSLPEESRQDVSDFMGRLIDGLGKYLDRGALESFAKNRAGIVPDRLAAVVKEIGGMFARVDKDTGAEALMKAAAGQRAKVAHLAGEAGITGTAGPDAVKQLTRITNHVSLIEDISRYAYRQIPVELDGRRSTVEMYVLNRGRAGKKPVPGSANILIALDTAYMGHVETLISLNQKNLRLRFGMERKELVGLTDPYMPGLGQALQAIGYRLTDVSTEVIARPVTPLTAEERLEPDFNNPARLDMSI